MILYIHWLSNGSSKSVKSDFSKPMSNIISLFMIFFFIRLFKVNVEYHFFVYDFFFRKCNFKWHFWKSTYEIILNFWRPVWKAVKVWLKNIFEELIGEQKSTLSWSFISKLHHWGHAIYPSLFSNNVHCTTKGLPYLVT